MKLIFMNKKITFFLLYFITLFILPQVSRSQISGSISEESGYIYDIVEPKTLEIDLDFNREHYYANTNANAKKITINVQADLKYFNAPSITLRYGIIRNLEFQVLTGYTGVFTTANATINTPRNIKLKANQNVTGLNSLSMGFKAGLLSLKNERPSVAVTGLFTIPKVGNTVFAPDNLGADISLNLYNSFSDKVDLAYSFGTLWSGFKDDQKNSYNYSISPGYTFSDAFGLYVDFTGLLQQGSSSDNRFDVDLSFGLNDYISLDVYAGSSFNVKRFYFIGSSFSATIPF
jgi:hypothetical protein